MSLFFPRYHMWSVLFPVLCSKNNSLKQNHVHRYSFSCIIKCGWMVSLINTVDTVYNIKSSTVTLYIAMPQCKCVDINICYWSEGVRNQDTDWIPLSVSHGLRPICSTSFPLRLNYAIKLHFARQILIMFNMHKEAMTTSIKLLPSDMTKLHWPLLLIVYLINTALVRSWSGGISHTLQELQLIVTAQKQPVMDVMS